MEMRVVVTHVGEFVIELVQSATSGLFKTYLSIQFDVRRGTAIAYKPTKFRNIILT
jgi:hypothetical protein